MLPGRSTPADREEFQRALTDRNLRHIWWLSLLGGIFMAGFTVVNHFRPLPLGGWIDGNNLFDVGCAVTSLWLIRHFRRRPVDPRWPRLFVVLYAVVLLAASDFYFFSTLTVYQQTSGYVVCVVAVSVLILLPPRTLCALFLINHIVYLSVLFTRYQDLPVRSAGMVDGSFGFLTGALAGWLLYRAFQENFYQQRTITERNLELARLHKLELDEKISAQLAEQKARLEVLRYQLNPHFLYNTLNSIYSLVALQPEAGPMVLRLAEFCRLTLTRGSELQSVAAEFAMLRAYLDIEQFRWGEKLAVTIEQPPETQSALLPPFLLLPLVENAIKHGLATSRHRLEVALLARTSTAGALEIEVANTGVWSTTPAPGVASTSIGLENLRRRLAHTWPERHTFSIGQEGNRVVARLTIPLTRSEADSPVMAN